VSAELSLHRDSGILVRLFRVSIRALPLLCASGGHRAREA